MADNLRLMVAALACCLALLPPMALGAANGDSQSQSEAAATTASSSGSAAGEAGASRGVPAAHAAAAPADPTTRSGHPVDTQQVLSEVVVTAEKRRERAIDVPISLTVIDSSAISATGATNLDDLQYTVPGLTSMAYTAGGADYIELRGVSDPDVGVPTVGRYFDEMPINLQENGAGMDVRFLDMANVEVLRGPQPTLYGDDAMGGVIRYVPASPTLAPEPSGAISAGYTSMDGGGTGWLTHGHVDFSLIPDRVGMRLAAWFEKDGGWIERAPTGQKDINSNDVSTLRATLLAKPTDRTELKLLWQHSATRSPNQNFGTDYVTQTLVPSYNNTDSDFLEGVFSVDLGFAKLVETPDYLRFRWDEQYDVSSFYVPELALLGIPPGYVTQIGLSSTSDANIFYNEMRLVSQNEGWWSWSAGFDYKDSRLDGVTSSPTSPNALPFTLLSAGSSEPDESEAIWAQLGYAFGERWHASIGARYYRDHLKELIQEVAFAVPTTSANSGVFTSTDPRLDVSYAIGPDWNVYADVGKGFRSGGFNPTYPAALTYAPDSLWTGEIGSKGLFLQRRLSLDADVYYNDWKNVQNSFTLPTGFGVIVNSGIIKGVGADLDATLRPITGLELGATMGWNNMAYREAAPGLSHAVGDPPDLAVRQSWSAFIDYRYPIPSVTGVSLYGRSDFQHANRALDTLRVPPYASIYQAPPHDFLNLRLGLTFDRYDVSIYADNALNESKPMIQGPFGVISESVEMRPRMYGVTLRATF